MVHFIWITAEIVTVLEASRKNFALRLLEMKKDKHTVGCISTIKFLTEKCTLRMFSMAKE